MKKDVIPPEDVSQRANTGNTNKPSSAKINAKRVAFIAVTMALLSLAGYWPYYNYQVKERFTRIESSFASSTIAFQKIVSQQRVKISDITKENTNLNNLLTDEQRRRLELENIKANNEKQIDTLTKLTTIDPELIKKYSKVFFLSENYTPAKLKTIDAAYMTDPLKPAEILDNVYPFLMNMLKDADNNQVHILAISAYRSFEYQKNLKSDYKMIYGAGTANQFSADQGYSEHQLGTAVDLDTPGATRADIDFQTTAAFKWLNENAYKYGFVLSYPKANKYYQYEPWHWRFVGRQLALDLHNQGKYFYEMDQREIDTYLIKLFD